MEKEYSKKARGDAAEKQACRFLKKHGCRIICRNFTCKRGEIDLIALDKKTGELVFIEVRFRAFDLDAAIESIGYTKRQRIFKAAAWFLLINSKYAEFNIRFDIVALSLDENKRWLIEHIPAAFRQW